MNLFHYKNVTSYIASVLVVAIMVAASPLSHTKVVYVEPAEAFTVKDVLNFANNVKTSVESTISAIADVAIQIYEYDEWVKENILDPLFWGLANALISNMLTSLTAWVNSGFQGSPAFVTNIEGFLTDVVDEAVGRFINGSELGFLCSPFELDIRIALSLQYYGADGYEPQCTLSDVVGNMENFLNGNFAEGGWAGWFELTQGANNDPNKAFLNASAERDAIVLRTRDGEFEILKANKFFKNIQICEEGVSLSGSINNCTVTTPGGLVETQFNQYLGIPGQKLAFADEFNELVGAVLAQFGSTLITGVGGLLGAGGNSAYAYRGESGAGPTLLERTQTETSGAVATGGDPIQDAITTQQNYRRVMNQTIAFVDRQETRIEDLEEQYPVCFNAELPPVYTDARTEAVEIIPLINQVIVDLRRVQRAYNQATTTQAQLDLTLAARQIQFDTAAASQVEVAQAEVNLEIILMDVELRDFDEALQNEESRCDRLLNGI